MKNNHLIKTLPQDNERPAAQNIAAFILLALCLVALIYLGPQPLVYLLFALAAAFFILPTYYSLGLSLMIGLTMVFEQFFTLTPLTLGETVIKLYPLDIVIGLSLVAFVIYSRLGKKRLQFVWDWPEKILLLFIVVIGLFMAVSIFDVNSDWAVAFSSFKNYCWYPIIYFLIINSIQDKAGLKKIIQNMFMFGIFIIAFLVIGASRGQGLWTEYTPLSTEGSRLLASTHAFFMSMILVIGASLFIANKLKNKLFINLVMILWAIGIVVSLMRHLWLAVALGIAVIFFLNDKPGKSAMAKIALKNVAVIAAVVAIIFLVTSVVNLPLGDTFAPVKYLQERVLSFSDVSSDTSASWRLDLWRDAGKLWLQSPIWGVGLGKTIFIDWGDWKNFEEIRNLHNSPLAIMVQTGLVGLGLLIAFVIAVFIKSAKSILKNKDLAPYYIGIIGALVAFILGSFFQPYLETNVTGIFFWILLALLRTASTINQPEAAAKAGQAVK